MSGTMFSRLLLDWIGFFPFLGLGLPFTLYLVLQAAALIVLRGRLWFLSLVPIPLVVLCMLMTGYLFQADSNIWPVPMLSCGGPFGFLFMGCVWFLARWKRRERKEREALGI
jgi:hypothetical protein